MAARKTSKVASKVSDKVGSAVSGAKSTLKKVPAPSPNPMTNLILTDIVLRGSGQLMRHAVERTLLGTRYPKDKAKNIVKGRSLTHTLLATAVARVATRSVPGMLLVGGASLAKLLYDRRQDQRSERVEGEREIADQAAEGARK